MIYSLFGSRAFGFDMGLVQDVLLLLDWERDLGIGKLRL